MKFKRQVSDYETKAKSKGEWKRNSFIFHLETFDIIKDFTGEQVKEFLFSMCCYQKGEEVNIDDRFVCMAFKFVKNQMDNETAKYVDTCKKRKRNVEKRYQKDNEDGGVNENEGAEEFTPPTLKEIQAYIDEKGYGNINAESFYYYYESIGWKIRGKSIIKWRPLVDRWEIDPNNDYYNANC